MQYEIDVLQSLLQFVDKALFLLGVFFFFFFLLLWPCYLDIVRVQCHNNFRMLRLFCNLPISWTNHLPT